MKMLAKGFTGWARLEQTSNETLRVTDTAITVVVTLLAAVTFALLHG